VFTQISSLPTIDQTLQDVITEQWTIEKLTIENKLVRERLSLKDIILDLEELVLANAEGIDDSFEEVFKLVYAKLYDEWAAANDPSRNRRIHFRIYGESPQQLYDKINGLLAQGKNKWRGIFGLDERIRLRPEHLQVCISFLQDVKLFNANLQVIDDAFEYLLTKVAKAEKGQYFTPRWVIDMCVKMLNPRINERVIDTACGSSGFTVHTIFWVWGSELTVEGPTREQADYAATMVYGIDSSPKAVKIARALNLIAGDGKSNVYELNSLNPPRWPDEGKVAFRPLLYRYLDEPPRDEENQHSFQHFDFDVLLTNPPFAGRITERDILKQYKLAERNGKTVPKIGRDILFIERNLRFLKPGGRMAIVLPQGRLSNSSDLHIRNFLFEKARLLGVVGLHINTFKPFTGTKTSILFLQKYTDDEIARLRQAQTQHDSEWNSHVQEVRKQIETNAFTEDNLPPLLSSFLSAEFGPLDDDDQTDDADAVSEGLSASNEELEERIANLESQLADMPGRARGKAELKRTIHETKRELASRALHTRLAWVVSDAATSERYKENWLTERASTEHDYPIFLAVSENGGKDNSGDPIYKKDEAGVPLLDSHGHLVVEHDLDEIAEGFIRFARENALNFWP
jgi:type I restriction enzyme M protein